MTWIVDPANGQMPAVFQLHTQKAGSPPPLLKASCWFIWGGRPVFSTRDKGRTTSVISPEDVQKCPCCTSDFPNGHNKLIPAHFVLMCVKWSCVQATKKQSADKTWNFIALCVDTGGLNQQVV